MKDNEKDEMAKAMASDERVGNSAGDEASGKCVGVDLATADLATILRENKRRNEALEIEYDPISGKGSYGKRVKKTVQKKDFYLPAAMLEENHILAKTRLTDMEKIRIRYDFEYWCARCVVIKDKTSSRLIPFVLNAPQRRVLATMEGMRERREPIRMILLKARQWGGSTLIQIYMAWMQIVHHKQWNSIICGHLKDASSAIKGMYSRLLKNYPKTLQSEGKPMSFKPFERSRNVSKIEGRESLVMSGSSGTQEGMRGFDLSMAHLTEVAYWKSTEQKSPESLVGAVCGTVAMLPDTIIVLESTANGVGNYFHTEWLRSKAHESDKEAVFVPWNEIEIYRHRVEDASMLIEAMDDYEKKLWERGLTLEMIAWYHAKRREYSTHQQMMAEYPSDDIEAFASTNNGIFATEDIERMRPECYNAPLQGELEGNGREGTAALTNVHFVSTRQGGLKVWKQPDSVNYQIRNRYYVVVDVGGLSEKSDYSVIAVLDRVGESGKPEIVAQWRGHTDHDLLAWKAAQIAKWYCNGLLIVESNTLESEHTEGDGSGFILDLVHSAYSNLYRRRTGGEGGRSDRYGFHTNRRSKDDAIYWLMKMLRENRYIEHDEEALEEYSCYERKSDGTYGAKAGHHDDILMTRGIGLYLAVCRNERPEGESECHKELVRQNSSFFGRPFID